MHSRAESRGSIRSPEAPAIVSLLGALWVAVLLLAHSSGESQSHPNSLRGGSLTRRPNIVFIRTDDQDQLSMVARRPDTGTYVMQNTLDLIAARGVTFANSFVSMPLCSPSRATFLSGQYAHNHNVLTNSPPTGGYNAFDHTNALPVWLSSAGYYNVHIGKYLNGYTGVGIPPGWDEWFTTIHATYFGPTFNDNGVLLTAPASDYVTDLITREAVTFIHEGRSREKPFFLVIDHTAPHASSPPVLGTGQQAIPAPRYAHVFDHFIPSWPINFNEQDVSDKPAWIQQLPELVRSQITQSLLPDYRARLASLLSVDEGVADIFRALDESGDLENTYVFFTSDNGFESGQHRITGGKDTIYEEAIRVPLLVCGPGIPAGTVLDALVANIDYAPTIVDIAGATANRVMDGRSLLPLLLGQEGGWRRDLLIEDYERPFRGIRNDRYLYAEEDSNGDGVVDGIELYNFLPDACSPTADPFELQSKHASPCYQALIARLHERLRVLRSCSGGSCH